MARGRKFAGGLPPREPFVRQIGVLHMRKVNRIVAAAVIGTGLACGTYGFLGSPMMPVAQARLHDHPKLDAASHALADARDYIEHTGGDWHGHKTEALHAINEAMHEVALAAGEHDKRSATAVRPVPLEHHRHEKLWEARERVKEARAYLHDSRDDFHGHKEAALHWIDETLHQLDRLMED